MYQSHFSNVLKLSGHGGWPSLTTRRGGCPHGSISRALPNRGGQSFWSSTVHLQLCEYFPMFWDRDTSKLRSHNSWEWSHHHTSLQSVNWLRSLTPIYRSPQVNKITIKLRSLASYWWMSLTPYIRSHRWDGQSIGESYSHTLQLEPHHATQIFHYS